MNLAGLLLALRFLTRISVPGRAPGGTEQLGRAAIWFPLVGAIIGLLVTAGWLAGSLISPWVAGLAALGVWVLVTGGLHLDGLGDVADALAASHADPARFREVARDPHAGSFAVIAIVLVLLAKLVLLSGVTGPAMAVLALVPAWARWSAVVVAYLVPPLYDGLGQSFRAGLSGADVAVPLAVLMAASLWLAPLLIAGILAAGLAALYWKWRLGGITGDCLGATIEMVEIVLLLVLFIRGGAISSA